MSLTGAEMSIRIEIKTTELARREVPSKGRTFTFLEQEAWAHTMDKAGQANPYPEKIRVTLPRGQETPYPAGDYTLHPASFYVGQYGDLAMSPRLAPVKAR
jgi:hypothetical protein